MGRGTWARCGCSLGTGRNGWNGERAWTWTRTAGAGNNIILGKLVLACMEYEVHIHTAGRPLRLRENRARKLGERAAGGAGGKACRAKSGHGSCACLPSGALELSHQGIPRREAQCTLPCPAHKTRHVPLPVDKVPHNPRTRVTSWLPRAPVPKDPRACMSCSILNVPLYFFSPWIE